MFLDRLQPYIENIYILNPYKKPIETRRLVQCFAQTQLVFQTQTDLQGISIFEW